jgi:AcrR family transcriptional regulator
MVPKLGEQARAARREQIAAAALACFARAGYHATTMEDIAVAAGVSKGTPYLYFPGKEALFLALHQEWGCGLTERVDAAVGSLTGGERRSPRRILRAVAGAVAAHVAASPQICRVLMEIRALAGFEPAIAAVVRDADARSREQLEGLFAAGIAAGEWPAGTDPALQARLLTAGLYGLMAQWHLEPGSFSLDAAAAALTGDAPARPGDHAEAAGDLPDTEGAST